MHHHTHHNYQPLIKYMWNDEGKKVKYSLLNAEYTSSCQMWAMNVLQTKHNSLLNQSRYSLSYMDIMAKIIFLQSKGCLLRSMRMIQVT